MQMIVPTYILENAYPENIITVGSFWSCDPCYLRNASSNKYYNISVLMFK